MSRADIKIDLSEQFEHLPHAPIVEAVIHFRARAENKLEPDRLLAGLKEKLPEYPDPQQQQEFGIGAEFRPEGHSVHQHHHWHGFRFQTADKLQVAQFTRNGFVFSRLKPYEDWGQFEAEALRLWAIHRELAAPTEIQRLGVRFINQILPVQPDRLGDLLTIPPYSPDQMPMELSGFMHQSTFEIPGQPYNLNVIQTIQPPSPPDIDCFGLILDLNVFTTRTVELTEIERHLLQMQWIKNKAFFSFLTKNALSQFREQS